MLSLNVGFLAILALVCQGQANSLNDEMAVISKVIQEMEDSLPGNNLSQENGSPINGANMPFTLPDLPFPFPGLPTLVIDLTDTPLLEGQIIEVPMEFPFAPPDFALYNNCHKDREQFCADLPPPYTAQGLFDAPCFTQNFEKLSVECKDMANAFNKGPDVFTSHVHESIVGECMDDKKNHCGDSDVITSPWKIFTSSCLANNRESLSDACKNKFDGFTSAHTENSLPEGYKGNKHTEIFSLPCGPSNRKGGMSQSNEPENIGNSNVIEIEEIVVGGEKEEGSNISIEFDLIDNKDVITPNQGSFDLQITLGDKAEVPALENKDDVVDVNYAVKALANQQFDEDETEEEEEEKVEEEPLLPEGACPTIIILICVAGATTILAVMFSFLRARNERNATIRRAMSDHSKSGLLANEP